MRKNKAIACSVTAILAVASVEVLANVSAQETGTQELRDDTREDILDGYQILTRHHPGMHNPFDPGFGERLMHARDGALLAADSVNTEADRFLAVQIINRSLSDGHARIQTAFNGSIGEWPGFRDGLARGWLVCDLINSTQSHPWFKATLV